MPADLRHAPNGGKMNDRHRAARGSVSLRGVALIAVCSALGCAALSALLLVLDVEPHEAPGSDSSTAYEFAPRADTPRDGNGLQSPQSAQRRDTHSLSVPAGSLSFAARLTDQAGHVLPLLPFELAWQDQAPVERDLATDLWGRFQCTFAAPRIRTSATLRIRTALGAFEHDFAALTEASSGKTQANRVDGGDWILPLTANVAAGEVVDPQSNPIAGATIYADLLDQDNRCVVGRSDHAGRFVVHAAAARGGMRLRVEHPQYETLQLDGCVAGAPATLALQLRLGPTTILAGRAVLPTALVPGSVQLRLSFGDGDVLFVPLNERGEFRVTNLRTNRLRVDWLGPSTLRETQDRTILASEGEISIASGQTTTLPTRDLTQSLRTYQCLLQQSPQTPHTQLEVQVLSRSEKGELRQQYVRTNEAGVLSCVLESDTSAARIVAERWRIGELPLESTPQVVAISLAPPYELSLPVRCAATLADRDLAKVRVELEDPDPLQRWAHELSSGPQVLSWKDDTLQLLVTSRGTYRITVDMPGATLRSGHFDVSTQGAASPLRWQ